MNFEWFVAKRYLWSKRRHPFVGVMGWISVTGIAVGVAALIVVLAVMNGFDEELKSRIIGTRAHLLIEKASPFLDSDSVITKLEQVKGVKGASAFIEGQALCQVEEWGTGVLIRGIDPVRERGASNFYRYLSQGTLTDRVNTAVIGSELAKRSGLHLGSKFQIATQNTQKPVTYTVEGIFSSGLYEYDANLIFTNLKNAQTLYGLGNAVGGVSVYLKHAEEAEALKKKFGNLLKGEYILRSWMDLNKTYFAALKLEKTVMFVILALIVLVACFNIAASLTLLVMDKTRDIGVLKALGATNFSLMKIFAMDGLALGVAGSGIGLSLGTVVCLVLKRYSFIELPKEIYYISKLPVQMSLSDTLWVMGVAIALSFIFAIYPAIVAGRLDPVKALRYE